jgi:hypothetical protein
MKANANAAGMISPMQVKKATTKRLITAIPFR